MEEDGLRGLLGMLKLVDARLELGDALLEDLGARTPLRVGVLAVLRPLGERTLIAVGARAIASLYQTC